MRAGMVEWDTEAEWYPGCMQELIQFPRGAYMDQVDALAWIAIGLDRIVEAPTKQEIEQMEWDEEYESTYFGEDNNGNWLTGY